MVGGNGELRIVAENAPMEKTTIPKDPPGNATPDENQPIEVMLLKQCHVYHPPVSPSHQHFYRCYVYLPFPFNGE
jgi:hypothetical protein